MTTWAYKRGIVAADRLVCHGDRKAGTLTKIAWKRDHDGKNCCIVGCGNTSDLQRINRTFLAYQGTIEEIAINAIHFEKEGQICIFKEDSPYYWYADNEDGWFCRLDLPDFTADGTGRNYALGAMAMGADAMEAVAVAHTFDNPTGCKIDFFNLNDENPSLGRYK